MRTSHIVEEHHRAKTWARFKQGYNPPRLQQQQQQGENRNEYQGQKRTQSFKVQMLQFIGDNKKLLNLHEQKFAELETFKSNTQTLMLHSRTWNTGWAAGLNLVKPDQGCIP